MTTAAQIFKAACSQALEDKELRNVSVEKILNRLDIDVVLEMQRALAQQFILLMRHAPEQVDPTKPRLPMRERIARMEQMRDVTK
jgi:hypothetical protein